MVHNPPNRTAVLPQQPRQKEGWPWYLDVLYMETLLFGSQPKEMAIAEAVEEISLIHSEMKKNFEV